jgi:hypothetical protein
MVVWTSLLQDRSQEGVFGQFLSAGSSWGEERKVNTTIISKQIDPVVASDGRSRFLAVWSSFVGSSGFDILAQRYQTTQPEGFVFPASVTGGTSLEWVSAAPVALSKSAVGAEVSARSLQVSWIASLGQCTTPDVHQPHDLD